MRKYKELFSFAEHSLDDTLIDLAVRFVINCPPEDISTAVRLFFQLEEAHWFYEDFVREQNPALPSMKMKTFVAHLYEAMPLMKLVCPDPTAALAEFQSYKSSIPVRGGILVNEKLDKVLMVRSWKGRMWGFPRGKINKEEDDAVCATREVLEETGYDMGALINPSDYIESTYGGKNVRLYVVSGVPEKTHFETQTRKEISKIEWIPMRKLPAFNRKTNNTSSQFYMVAPFMNGLKAYIAKKKGYATKLSKSESSALKNMLGITAGFEETVHNDEATAQHLLAQLKGTSSPIAPGSPQPVPAETQQSDKSTVTDTNGYLGGGADHERDKEILLNLLRGGTPETGPEPEQHAEVDGAKEILGLLKNEIATEKTMKTPPVVEPIAKPSDTSRTSVKAPALPPNELLQSLMSSRRSTPLRRPSVPTPNDHHSTAPSKSSLLNLLNRPKQAESARLMALLKPIKPPQPAPRTRRSPLMDLLKDSKDPRSNESSNTDGGDRSIENMSEDMDSAPPSKSSTLSGADDIISTQSTSTNENPLKAKSTLLGLLQPQTPSSHSPPSCSSQHSEAAALDQASIDDADPEPTSRVNVSRDAGFLQRNSKRHTATPENTGGSNGPPQRQQSSLLSLLDAAPSSKSSLASSQEKTQDNHIKPDQTRPQHKPAVYSAAADQSCQTSPEVPAATGDFELLSQSIRNDSDAKTAHPSPPGVEFRALNRSENTPAQNIATDPLTDRLSGPVGSRAKPNGMVNPLLKLLEPEGPAQQGSSQPSDPVNDTQALMAVLTESQTAKNTHTAQFDLQSSFTDPALNPPSQDGRQYPETTPVTKSENPGTKETAAQSSKNSHLHLLGLLNGTP